MFKITFKTANSAFHSDGHDEPDNGNLENETLRILMEISVYITNGWRKGSVMDLNGNEIGEWILTK